MMIDHDWTKFEDILESLKKIYCTRKSKTYWFIKRNSLGLI